MRMHGLFACLVWASVAGGCAGDSPPDEAQGSEHDWNVVLISIDTLRADRLSCYGYKRATSPNIDALAASGARFENCVSESPWTLPSHTSMLTGRYPASHGVTKPEHRPGSSTRFLAEELRAQGWRTFGFTDGGWMSSEWGFGRGFDVFEAERRGLPAQLERAQESIASAPPEQPWFAFVHTYDVHCPYDPPEPYASQFVTPQRVAIDVAGRCGNPDFNELELTPGEVDTLSDHYDGSVSYVDEQLAGFLAFLKSRGDLERTVIVLTSDHGDEFYEHGRIGHERSIHRELLHIPLIICGPTVVPQVSSTPTGLVDIVATIFDLLGRPAPRGMEGRSLATELQGGPSGEVEPYRYSELEWNGSLRSLMGRDFHLVHSVIDGESQLFDLRVDPVEQNDVAAQYPDLTQRLTANLKKAHRALSAKRAATEDGRPLGPEHVEALRRLGYIGD